MNHGYKSKYHATFDEFELPVSLHCLCCNGVIGVRAEVPSKQNPAAMVHSLLKAENYREREVALSDGSVAYLPHCLACINEPLDEVDAMAQVKRTWRHALEHAGRPAEAIKKHDERVKHLKILRGEGVIHAR